jgi:hypothetical protein
LTVPMLAFLLFLLVDRAPSLLAIMWDSFLDQTANFSTAQSTGNVLGVATSVSQMLILALEMVGIACLLYALGRALVRAIWNWSKPTPTRRVTGALIAVIVIALVAFLWTS